MWKYSVTNIFLCYKNSANIVITAVVQLLAIFYKTMMESNTQTVFSVCLMCFSNKYNLYNYTHLDHILKPGIKYIYINANTSTLLRYKKKITLTISIALNALLDIIILYLSTFINKRVNPSEFGILKKKLNFDWKNY